MITQTRLSGLVLIQREAAQNEFEADTIVKFEELADADFKIRQINHSHSVKGVLRGLHAEHWNKIVWLVRGQAFCAITDIRLDSPTFGEYEDFELSADNRQALYIPDGFANSVYALTDIDYLYMVSKTYDGTDTFAVAWDDPDIGIAWPKGERIISQRDQNNPRLRDLYPTKFS